MTDITIGVDISKDHLEVHRLPDGEARQFANTRPGHKALIAWLKTAPPARVVYEPTGPYHRTFERVLEDAGFPMAKVNPRFARRFAEALGTLAKTDRADAALLARMGAVLTLPVRPVASTAMRELEELLGAREALIKEQTATKNREKTLTLSVLKRQHAARLKQIATQLATVDREIEKRIGADKTLKARFDILISIPGIGAITAASLLVTMPELGTLEPKQVASLAGLAPIVRQSGTMTGRAKCRDGRAHVRQAIYMPALVACRFNPDLKAMYDRLIAAGKPAKVAITAVMRKLLIFANALLRDGRKWDACRSSSGP